MPNPGSPTISTSWPSPCRARSQRRISMPISSSRPTSGVRWRCPARRPPPLARTIRNSVTGSGTPLSSWLPRSSATNSPATCRCTRAVTTTAPGSASACTRAAMFGTSPKISPPASSTAGPVSMAMRAASSGLPAPSFLRFNSAERALDRKRRAYRALGVVLLRDRIAEQCHQSVAELLGDLPPISITAAEAASR